MGSYSNTIDRFGHFFLFHGLFKLLTGKLFIEAGFNVNVWYPTLSFFSCVGVLSDIHLEVPPLQEAVHPFSMYFLVPGDYTLQAASVIIDPTDVLRARAKAESPDEPILCRGSPFHIRAVGTV